MRYVMLALLFCLAAPTTALSSRLLLRITRWVKSRSILTVRLLRVLLDLELIINSISIGVIMILKNLVIFSYDVVILAIEAILRRVLLLALEQLLLLRRRDIQILDRNKMVWHVHVVVLVHIEVFVCKVDAARNSWGFYFTVLLSQMLPKSRLTMRFVILIIEIHFVKSSLLGVAVDNAIL